MRLRLAKKIQKNADRYPEHMLIRACYRLGINVEHQLMVAEVMEQWRPLRERANTAAFEQARGMNQ